MASQSKDGISPFLSGTGGDDESEVGRRGICGEKGVDDALAYGKAETTACENLARAFSERLKRVLRICACHENACRLVFSGGRHGGEESLGIA